MTKALRQIGAAKKHGMRSVKGHVFRAMRQKTRRAAGALHKKHFFARVVIRKKENAAKTAKKPCACKRGGAGQAQIFVWSLHRHVGKIRQKPQKKPPRPNKRRSRASTNFCSVTSPTRWQKYGKSHEKNRRVRTRGRRRSAIFIGSRQIAVRARVKGEICAGVRGEICAGTKGEIPI